MMASQLLPLTLSSVLFFSLILHVYHALNRPGFIPVKTYGDTDPNARKVILIPGLDGCTSFYADTLPELTAQGYSVVMFHIPLAPRPWPLNQLYALIDPANERQPGDHGEYTFEFMAAQLLQQMVVLGIDKADIVGESFGGVIALHFALAYPDRVDRLVLISSLAKTELTPAVQFKATFALPVVRAFGMLFPGAAQTLFALLHTDDVVEAHEPLWLKRMFQKEASWADHYSVMGRLSIVIPLDITERVKHLHHPTLIVYGSEDTFTAHSSADLTRLLPNAIAAPLPGGHLPHISAPKEFAALVHGWLTTTEPGGLTSTIK